MARSLKQRQKRQRRQRRRYCEYCDVYLPSDTTKEQTHVCTPRHTANVGAFLDAVLAPSLGVDGPSWASTWRRSAPSTEQRQTWSRVLAGIILSNTVNAQLRDFSSTEVALQTLRAEEAELAATIEHEMMAAGRNGQVLRQAGWNVAEVNAKLLAFDEEHGLTKDKKDATSA